MEQHEDELLIKELNKESGGFLALMLLMLAFGFGSHDQTEE